MAITEIQIKETIFKLLKNIAPDSSPEALGQEDDVRETLGIDSYDFLNFMIGVNEEFGVEIPETAYGKLITLNDMTQYILAHAQS
ncbi:acyl carrier protein [Alkalinema sp. FACHB-956]|uniref:acyl carrier protein n=1 Tax=Alkalinema sp. FACHB-956 TaxID=2692768 RepID=UPI0016854F6B|nr:acyl carrier protein [Alkalinema sp. FACHB-956]MBD2327115.1 acyl carrier protein [Alkalinema sp. FACHB-956]